MLPTAALVAERWEKPAAPRRGRYGMTVLAVAFAAGIAAAPWLGTSVTWLAIAAGAWLLLSMWWPRRRRTPRRGGLAGLALAMAAAGAAWSSARWARVAPDDLAARIAPEPSMVRLRGVAMDSARARPPSRALLAPWSHEAPSSAFTMRVEAIVGPHSRESVARGDVLVRVDGPAAPVRAGDRVTVTGTLRPPSPPRNPGGFDGVRYARSIGRAGTLDVESPALVERAPPRGWWRLLRWRAALRERAAAGIERAAGADDDERRALLAAMLLGERGDGFEPLSASFRRVGLAHLLAISGLHLGVLAGFLLALGRIGGRPRRWQAWLVIGGVLLYLLLVEVRLPVLRAAVMTIVACLGLACGRRIAVGSLVALSAILLLAWRPDQLFGAGFQLSYGVVLALIHLAPRLRRRWFGPPDANAASSAAMILECAKTTLAVAFTAWIVAAPITLHHFGMLSPLAVPLSVVGVPLAALLLALGFTATLIGLAAPAAAALLRWPLALPCEILLAMVDIADRMPLSCVFVPPPSSAWSIAATIVAILWMVWPGRRARRVLLAVSIALTTWLAWPLLPLPRPPLRIDMLAVGDGSCYLVRGGRRAVLFDAGSAHDPDVGERVIVPALRALGVRALDALIISHPNLDHYSGVPEIVGAIPTRLVLVTPQLLADAGHTPGGPVAALLAHLEAHEVEIETIAAGAERSFGRARWCWLHPPPQWPAAPANDGSMVIEITAAGRRLLFCGDIEAGAMEALRNDRLLRGPADILELPHHGSHSGEAEGFVAALSPAVVLQSTGHSRWRRDRWEGALRGTTRLVTARDGAGWVEVDREGRLRVESRE